MTRTIRSRNEEDACQPARRLVARRLHQITDSDPAQWSGELESGQPVFIRYCNGQLVVRIGPRGGYPAQAVIARPWLLAAWHGGAEATLTSGQMMARANIRLERSIFRRVLEALGVACPVPETITPASPIR